MFFCVERVKQPADRAFNLRAIIVVAPFAIGAVANMISLISIFSAMES